MIIVHTQLDPPYRSAVEADRLATIVESVLQTEGISSAELSVVITSDEAVRALNLAYRQIDASTDVLSFETMSSDDDFLIPAEDNPYLGDIIISCPTARKQAAVSGHTPAEEILLLAIHGTLHLLGYGHQTPDDKEAMWRLQRQILVTHNLGHVTPTE